MICTSIAEPNIEKCLKALEELDFAEIRLDQMSTEAKELKKIFSTPKKLIATCRPNTKGDTERKSLLIAAIEAGASFVDIEIDANDKYRTEIMKKARASGCQVIISYHNQEETPGRSKLKRLVKSCFDSGADIAKIACQINVQKDNSRLLGLLECRRPLIVIGMGDQGKICRIIAPLLGSPFTYASLATGKETAQGQIYRSSLEDLITRIQSV